MLVGLSGPAAFYDVGDIYECDSSEAARLIGARFAVPFVEDGIERAVAPVVAIETRPARTPKKKG
jgi:hypothetical protein